MPDSCPHTRTRMIWTKWSNYGAEFVSRQLRHQCLDCSRILSFSLKHSLATPATPEISREEAMRSQKSHLLWMAQKHAELERQSTPA